MNKLMNDFDLDNPFPVIISQSEEAVLQLVTNFEKELANKNYQVALHHLYHSTLFIDKIRNTELLIKIFNGLSEISSFTKLIPNFRQLMNGIFIFNFTSKNKQTLALSHYLLSCYELDCNNVDAAYKHIYSCIYFYESFENAPLNALPFIQLINCLLEKFDLQKVCAIIKNSDFTLIDANDSTNTVESLNLSIRFLTNNFNDTNNFSEKHMDRLLFSNNIFRTSFIASHFKRLFSKLNNTTLYSEQINTKLTNIIENYEKIITECNFYNNEYVILSRYQLIHRANTIIEKLNSQSKSHTLVAVTLDVNEVDYTLFLSNKQFEFKDTIVYPIHLKKFYLIGCIEAITTLISDISVVYPIAAATQYRFLPNENNNFYELYTKINLAKSSK